MAGGDHSDCQAANSNLGPLCKKCLKKIFKKFEKDFFFNSSKNHVHNVKTFDLNCRLKIRTSIHRVDIRNLYVKKCFFVKR